MINYIFDIYICCFIAGFGYRTIKLVRKNSHTAEPHAAHFWYVSIFPKRTKSTLRKSKDWLILSHLYIFLFVLSFDVKCFVRVVMPASANGIDISLDLKGFTRFYITTRGGRVIPNCYTNLVYLVIPPIRWGIQWWAHHNNYAMWSITNAQLPLCMCAN